MSDLESVCGKECKMLQYADDVVLYSDKHPVHEGLRNLESSLHQITRVLGDLG